MSCNSWGRKESDTTERLNWTVVYDYSEKNPMASEIHPHLMTFMFFQLVVIGKISAKLKVHRYWFHSTACSGKSLQKRNQSSYQTFAVVPQSQVQRQNSLVPTPSRWCLPPMRAWDSKWVIISFFGSSMLRLKDRKKGFPGDPVAGRCQGRGHGFDP